MNDVSKQDIYNIIEDLVSSFLYYDRKEDEDVRVGVIEEMVRENKITVDEMVDLFKSELKSRLE